MRVLYLERNLTVDGLVLDQVHRVQPLGVEVRVLALQVGRTPRLLPDSGISARCPFFPRVERVKAFLLVRAAWAAVRRIVGSGWRPNLVHAHLACPDGLAARAAASRLGVPCIITTRGDDLLTSCGIRNVTWLGQLPAAALAEEMRTAAVLVLPSVSEGWGSVIAEAMACGTPVVGARGAVASG